MTHSPSSNESMQALPAGTRSEEFVFERVLGTGGFGITYLADDRKLGRKVVIKENLPSQFCWRDPVSLLVRPRTTGVDADNFAYSLESFRAEAATLASLDHPGIVSVLRSFEANGTAYFVMPFIEGRALDEVMRQRESEGTRFSDTEIQDLLAKMLDALEYLHQRGIYHRDIKPGNILLTNAGPVLIDFGAARQHLSERSVTVIESAGYTPFEQLQSRGHVGPWSDIYALGATLYKAITGNTVAKANDRVFDDPYVPLATALGPAAGYSKSLLTSIDKSLTPSIGGRFQNAAEWRAALSKPASYSEPQAGVVPMMSSVDAVSPPQTDGAAVSQSVSRVKEVRKQPKVWLETLKTPVVIALVVGVAAASMFSFLNEKPFENSLGMLFVPAGTPGVLFSVWETRVKDFATFVEESGHDAIAQNAFGLRALTIGEGGEWKEAGGSWRDPLFPQKQSADHPVVCVSYLDAEAFCAWLTKKERATGAIPANAIYRLPSDSEWTRACGDSEYPWGDSYPPNSSDGNYAGEEAMIGTLQTMRSDLSQAGFKDGAARTEAVGMFKKNRFGLYDMGGNVLEWCRTWYTAELNNEEIKDAESGLKDDSAGQVYRVLRGASWLNDDRVYLRSSFRYDDHPMHRDDISGFRCVLVIPSK